jgi:Secretion system C-terminal sorting domain/Fibronectin type III domain
VINWTAVPSAVNGYGLRFRESTRPDWTIYHLGNVLNYTISGLKQGSTYVYNVYGACSNGEAPTSANGTFVAGTGQANDCNSATPNASTTFSNPVGARLSWTTTPAGLQVGKQYGVQYVDTSIPTVTHSVYLDSTKVSLFVGTHAGILPNKTYTYSLLTFCDGRLQWQNNTGTFTTPASSANKNQDLSTNSLPLGDGLGATSLQVYPNPTDSKLSVELGLESVANVGIKLTDATGRIVFNETVSSNGLNFKHDIDMKNLASGVYMLMVNVEGKTTVKRIVKQ